MVPVVTLCPQRPSMHLLSSGSTPGPAALTPQWPSTQPHAPLQNQQQPPLAPPCLYFYLRSLPYTAAATPSPTAPQQPFTALATATSGPGALMPCLKSYLCTLHHTVATTLSPAVLTLSCWPLIHLCASSLTWQDQP